MLGIYSLSRRKADRAYPLLPLCFWNGGGVLGFFDNRGPMAGKLCAKQGDGAVYGKSLQVGKHPIVLYVLTSLNAVISAFVDLGPALRWHMLIMDTF